MPLISFDFQIADFLACFKQIVNDLRERSGGNRQSVLKEMTQKFTVGLLGAALKSPSKSTDGSK